MLNEIREAARDVADALRVKELSPDRLTELCDRYRGGFEHGDVSDDLQERAIKRLMDAIGRTTGRQLERYSVQWAIDSDAETPEEAAREAWAAMRREDSIATVFDVVDREGTVVSVDLSELDDASILRL